MQHTALQCMCTFADSHLLLLYYTAIQTDVESLCKSRSAIGVQAAWTGLLPTKVAMCEQASNWAMFRPSFACTAWVEYLKQADRDGETGLITACFHSVEQLLEGAIVDPPVPWGTLHGVRLARPCASKSGHESHSFIHSLIHSFTHSLIHSFTHSLIIHSSIN